MFKKFFRRAKNIFEMSRVTFVLHSVSSLFRQRNSIEMLSKKFSIKAVIASEKTVLSFLKRGRKVLAFADKSCFVRCVKNLFSRSEIKNKKTDPPT